ncbi:MAG: MMPL family transporter [Nocardioidaceae bacterium]
MATLLYRLGKTAYRRWPVFLATWLAAMVAVAGFAATQSKPFSDSFSIPGIPSEKASDLQSELFPGNTSALDEATATVVVAAPARHTLREPAYAKKVDALIADLQAVPQMPKTPLADPVTASDAQFAQAVKGAVEAGTPRDVAETNAKALLPLSEDSRVGTITWNFDVDSTLDVKTSTQDAVLDALAAARADGLIAEVGGSGMQTMTDPGGTSELIGIGIALIVLVLTFGSLIAAGLPIVTAVFGLALGITGVTALTAFMDIGSSTPMLATMIGLAVGIDYALFILARYRSELEHSGDREEAVGLALGTAGSAVVFAGLTVVIALSALAVVNIPFLTAMGLAAAATVVIAVLVALTLLPAVLGLLKSKAFAGRVRRYLPQRDDDGRILNNGVRWARVVGKKPLAFAGLVVVVLGVLAVPVKDIHLALPTDSTAATETTQRKASDLITDAFGPGRNAPLLVVVDGRDLNTAERTTAYGEVVAWAADQEDVANAQLVGMNEAGDGAMVLVTPETGPDDTATENLLSALRDGQPEIEAKTGTTVGVTGVTAVQVDVSERLTGALPVYLAVVIGLAFILLMLVFRSILVPLTATLGFLLSVLATLGATVAIFQKGMLGLVPGQPLVSFMPIFLIGVVFGLAMDYQVFLVTRIREAHVHGMHMREAIVDGFRNSARVVSAAAVIMTSVFAAFILQPDNLIRSIGFALAAAVVFDAFVVRMVLIPALMYLMGDKAWWLPKWLDKILPNVDVEGERLLHHRNRIAGAQSDDDPEPDLVGV